MTVPPEAIEAARYALICGGPWSGDSYGQIRAALEAAAPLIAAAERDRCVKIVNDLADHYDNIEMHAWADEHRKIADLLADDQPSSRPGRDIHLASWGPVLDSPWKAEPESDQPSPEPRTKRTWPAWASGVHIDEDGTERPVP
jgi:hypothetical protein